MQIPPKHGLLYLAHRVGQKTAVWGESLFGFSLTQLGMVNTGLLYEGDSLLGLWKRELHIPSWPVSPVSGWTCSQSRDPPWDTWAPGGMLSWTQLARPQLKFLIKRGASELSQVSKESSKQADCAPHLPAYASASVLYWGINYTQPNATISSVQFDEFRPRFMPVSPLPQSRYKICASLQKVPSCPFPLNLPPAPQGQANTDLLSVTIGYLFLTLNE